MQNNDNYFVAIVINDHDRILALNAELTLKAKAGFIAVMSKYRYSKKLDLQLHEFSVKSSNYFMKYPEILLNFQTFC